VIDLNDPQQAAEALENEKRVALIKDQPGLGALRKGSRQTACLGLVFDGEEDLGATERSSKIHPGGRCRDALRSPT